MAIVSLSDIPDLKTIVVTKLQGGLGNLLFQYLAGLALAREHGVDLYCTHNGGMMHQSGLELIGIEPTYVSLTKDLLRRSQRQKDGRLTDHLKSLLGLWPLTPVTEPHFHFWPGFFGQSTGSLLSGYWQSPKYFQSIQGDISMIVRLKPILDRCDQGLIEAVGQMNSVSVHIRRGDFLNNPEALAVHGIVKLDYYDRARKTLEMNVRPDVYYIFSDAPHLAKQELSHWDKTIFIEGNTQQQDLALMSRCHHHIIANSSFSWWGAMLNNKSGKQVIAPQNWFTPEALQTRSLADLFPTDWHII